MRQGYPYLIMGGLFCSLFSVRVAQAAPYTFYIDGNTNYGTDHGCGTNNNLSDDTASLASQLIADGSWSGSHYTDTNAWPQDFFESCSSTYGAGGLDNIYADASLLSVFSGHANSGFLTFAYPHNGVCDVSVGTNSRLGSMNGGQSTFTIYYGCCSLALSGLVDGANWQWSNQAFGFLDNESDGDDDLKNFYLATSSSPNIVSWTSNLEDRPGWGTGDNSPIVVSYGATSNGALVVEDYAALRGFPFYNDPRPSGPVCGGGQPLFWYATYYVDNHNECG